MGGKRGTLSFWWSIVVILVEALSVTNPEVAILYIWRDVLHKKLHVFYFSEKETAGASLPLRQTGTISRLHHDTYATHVWLSQIRGRKQFICYPPEDTEKLGLVEIPPVEVVGNGPPTQRHYHVPSQCGVFSFSTGEAVLETVPRCLETIYGPAIKLQIVDSFLLERRFQPMV